MDYLFYCTGECEDALRDRDFYLVKNCASEDAARALLADWFKREEIGDGEDEANRYDVFVTGENIEDATADRVNWNYRFTTV